MNRFIVYLKIQN